MEVKESISELRQKLQAVRRSVDTWYGRNIMRRFSVYITRLLVQLDWSPNQATLLSLGIGLTGVVCLGLGYWGMGILGLNLWYLVDHVDGEIARYTGKSSITGCFFDTVVNFFIQPLTFFALGYGMQRPFFFALGLVATFGSMMLNVVPMCEASILLYFYQKNGKLPVTSVAGSADKRSKSIPRRVFAFAHYAVTYPSFLVLLTGCYLLLCMTSFVHTETLLGFLLFVYALLITGVWGLQLVHKVLSRTLDAIAGGDIR